MPRHAGLLAPLLVLGRRSPRQRCHVTRGPEATGTSKQSRGRFLMPLRGGSCFSGAARNKNKTKGRGGPLRVGIAAFTCPTHGPIPPPTHRRPLLGSLRVGWPLQGRGLPRGNHNGPKEAIASTRHKKSALPRPRPVGHQSTPWPHQTPTKHPRGPAHHPARLWWPWAASGLPRERKQARDDFHAPAGCDPGLTCRGIDRRPC